MTCNNGCHTTIGNPTVHEQIDKFIGSDFDTVKIVADNIEKLLAISELVGTDIEQMFSNILKKLGHNIIGSFENGCTITGPQQYVTHENNVYHLNVDVYPYEIPAGTFPNSDFTLGYRGSVKDWNAFDTALIEYAGLPITSDEDTSENSLRIKAFRALGIPAAWVEGRYITHENQLVKFGKDVYEPVTIPVQMGKTPIGDPKFRKFSVNASEITPNALETIKRYLEEAKAASSSASLSAANSAISAQSALESKEAALESKNAAAMSEQAAKESELVAKASADTAEQKANETSADAAEVRKAKEVVLAAEEAVLHTGAVVEAMHSDTEKWHGEMLNNLAVMSDQLAKANTASVKATQSAEEAKQYADAAKTSEEEAELHKAASIMAATAGKKASDAAVQAYNNASASEQGALVASHNATSAMESAIKANESAKANADRAAELTTDIHDNVTIAMQEAEKAKKSAEQAEDAKANVTELMVAIEAARAEVATNASEAKNSEQISLNASDAAVTARDTAQAHAITATKASETATEASASAQNSATAANQASTIASNSKDQAMLSALDAKNYAEHSQRIYDAFSKGAVYRGVWNPEEDQAYPDAHGVNSQWDVVLNKGSLVFNWNQDVWYPGDRLIWAASTKSYFHVQRAHGVTSVNGLTGSVVLTPEIIGALSSKGGIVNGEIVLTNNEQLPFGMTITAPTPVVKFNQIDAESTESVYGSLGIAGKGSDAFFVVTPNDSERKKIYHEGHKPTWEEVGGLSYFDKVSNQKGKAVKLTTDHPSLQLGDGVNPGFYPVANKKGNLGANGFMFNHIWGDAIHATTLKTTDLDASGVIREKGQRVYSPNNKPRAVDVGALPNTGGVLSGELILNSKSVGDFGVNIISPNPTVTFTQLRPEQDDYAGYIGMEGNGKDAFYVRTPTTNGRSVVYHEQNKPTAEALGVVNKAGDTMTGKLTVPFLGLNNNVVIQSDNYTGSSSPERGISFEVKNPNNKSYWFYCDKIRMNVNTELFEKGNRVYSPNNKPNLASLPGVANEAVNASTISGKTAQAIIAEARSGLQTADNVYTKTQADGRFLGISAKAADASKLNGRSDYYHPGNKPTAGAIGALSSTGGILTGELNIVNKGAITPFGLAINAPNPSIKFQLASAHSEVEDAQGLLDMDMDGLYLSPPNNSGRAKILTERSTTFVKKTGDSMSGALKMVNSEFEIHHTPSTNRAIGTKYYNAKGIIGLAGAQYQGNGTGITNYFFGDYDGGSKNPWSASSSNSWLSIAPSGVLHTVGKRIYHEGFKPTPTAIGAFKDGGNRNTFENIRGMSGINNPTGTAAPFGLANGAGWQSSYADGRFIQMYVDASARLHVRFNTTSDPNASASTVPWNAIYSTKHKPTASEVGAVSKTGDTMTGNLTVPLVKSNSLTNSASGRIIDYSPSEKIVRIGNSVNHETHTRVHGTGVGSANKLLSVWVGGTDKFVYHEGYKPTELIDGTDGVTTSINIKEHSYYTWLRNRAGNWTFQVGTQGDDWTRSFAISADNVDTGQGANNKWVYFGQHQSNSANGSYRGVAITKFANSARVGGDLAVGRLKGYNLESYVQPESNCTRITTQSGYIQIGAMNGGHAHIYTDRPNFYFNKELLVNNNYVYHTGRKPTANDVGAMPMGDAYTKSEINARASLTGVDNTIKYGVNALQYAQLHGNGGTGANGAQVKNPTNDWWHHLILNHANSAGYYTDIATCFHSDRIMFRRVEQGRQGDWKEVYHTGKKPTAAEIGALESNWFIADGSYPRFGKNNWLRANTNEGGFLPFANGESYLGTSGWRFNQAWVNNYYGGSMTLDGAIKSNGVSYASDFHTNKKTYAAFVCNGNRSKHFLMEYDSGSGNMNFIHRNDSGGNIKVWSMKANGNLAIQGGIDCYNVGSSWISQKDSTYVPIILNSVSKDSYAAGMRFKSTAKTGTVGSLGDRSVGFYGYNNGETVNQTNYQAYLSLDDGMWYANGVKSNNSSYKFGTGANFFIWNGGGRGQVLEMSTPDGSTQGGGNYTFYYNTVGNRFQLNGSGFASKGWATGSDERFKENITKVSDITTFAINSTALEKVSGIDTFKFTYKSSDSENFGFIAQNVEEALPEAVTEVDIAGKDSPEPIMRKFIDPMAISALHNEAIKELAIENQELKASNKALEDRVAALEKLVAQLIK